MSKRDEYFAKMDSQIKKWDAEVDKLKAKCEQMGAEARAKFAEQLNAMRATRDTAFKKLEELHGSSESAWRNLEAGVDTAWASMKSALEKAFMYRTSSGAAWTRPAAKTGRRSPDRRSRGTWSDWCRRRLRRCIPGVPMAMDSHPAARRSSSASRTPPTTRDTRGRETAR